MSRDCANPALFGHFPEASLSDISLVFPPQPAPVAPLAVHTLQKKGVRTELENRVLELIDHHQFLYENAVQYAALEAKEDKTPFDLRILTLMMDEQKTYVSARLQAKREQHGSSASSPVNSSPTVPDAPTPGL